MDPWSCSSVSPKDMAELVDHGLLPALSVVEEWWVPDVNHDVPAPPACYIISFSSFHVRGLATPCHRFLHALLHYYRIELQHLNPNGIQRIAAFVALCEGYLGIMPHFDLWRYFFAVIMQWTKGSDGQPDCHRPMGCASIHLWNHRVQEYVSMHLVSSNKGWHPEWFYLKNMGATPFPAYSGRGVFEAPDEWKRDVLGGRSVVENHLAAIKTLKDCGLMGVGIIGVYHVRGVAPLMRRALPLHLMAPGESPEGTGLGGTPPPRKRSSSASRER